MSLADELAKLDELHHKGALSDAEFVRAKEALLPAPQAVTERLADLEYRAELARMDREWDEERREYLVFGKYGHAYMPTKAQGIGLAAVGAIGGLALILLTAGAKGGFWFLGLALFLIGVTACNGWYICSQVRRYEQAYDAYLGRRAAVKRK